MPIESEEQGSCLAPPFSRQAYFITLAVLKSIYSWKFGFTSDDLFRLFARLSLNGTSIEQPETQCEVHYQCSPSSILPVQVTLRRLQHEFEYPNT